MVIIVGKTSSEQLVKLMKEYKNLAATFYSLKPEEIDDFYEQMKDLKQQIDDHIDSSLYEKEIIGSETYEKIRSKSFPGKGKVLANIITKDTAQRLAKKMERLLGENNEYVEKLKKVLSKTRDNEWIILWNRGIQDEHL